MEAPTSTAGGRRRNPRGQGERLREEILAAAARMLDQLGDDEALSLRAVAREIGVAAPSVYLHFADRDALVYAVLERCHDDLVAAAERGETAAADPAGQLREHTLRHVEWALRHPGLYKVLHESTLNQRIDMPFKRQLANRAVDLIQRCVDAGQAPPADPDPAAVALDLRTAVYGVASLRINQPRYPWPPLPDQLDRLLTKLVGIGPVIGTGVAEGEG
ncbi:MAG: TetR/AcrR family transcriptional regulator [Mycobacteriales bacterium]